MNYKIAAAVWVIPMGLASSLARPVSAAESNFSPVVSQSPAVVAQRYDDRRDRDPRNNDRGEATRRESAQREAAQREAARREQIRREQDRRQSNQRVWIPGHYEAGFLGIGRKWVAGHWEER
ncbi:MAG: hypothetical protein KME16_11610 [Scytolyngbya sp. HA4215-MV1]|jgi:Skp family chaperone for outer membrane proteins|nr:hypothetical protein [Scytolyngbya sp. HA4215-MV1]